MENKFSAKLLEDKKLFEDARNEILLKSDWVWK